MPTLRQKKLEEILQILRDKKGEATFRYVFSLMFQKYSLAKKTFWDYLEDLKTAGKIEYPVTVIVGNEDSMLIKLKEKKE